MYRTTEMLMRLAQELLKFEQLIFAPVLQIALEDSLFILEVFRLRCFLL